MTFTRQRTGCEVRIVRSSDIKASPHHFSKSINRLYMNTSLYKHLNTPGEYHLSVIPITRHTTNHSRTTIYIHVVMSSHPLNKLNTTYHAPGSEGARHQKAEAGNDPVKLKRLRETRKAAMRNRNEEFAKKRDWTQKAASSASAAGLTNPAASRARSSTPAKSPPPQLSRAVTPMRVSLGSSDTVLRVSPAAQPPRATEQGGYGASQSKKKKGSGVFDNFERQYDEYHAERDSDAERRSLALIPKSPPKPSARIGDIVRSDHACSSAPRG